MVQHERLFSARTIHFWNLWKKYGTGAGLRRCRRRDPEGFSAPEGCADGASLGSVQSLESCELRRPQPNRLHTQFRPHFRCRFIASDADRAKAAVLTRPAPRVPAVAMRQVERPAPRAQLS